MLQAQLYPHIPLREAVQQVQARQKAKHKLPTWYAQQGLLMPPPLSVEQASSEEAAHYKASLIYQRMLEKDASATTSTLADLTGGMGLDSWAFSRQFSHVQYVEQQPELTALAEYNFQQLQASNIQVRTAAAEAYLQELAAPLSVIYLDPARRDAAKNKVVLLSDCQPDVAALLPLLLEKGGQIWVKASPMLDIKGAIQELKQYVQEVQVVSVRGEVKELLFRLEATQESDPLISAVNLPAEGAAEVFSFRYSEEATAAPTIGMPQAFLYDPGAALRKAGAFKLPALRFNLQKLHPHSHLYTSAGLVSGFPGRSYSIREQVKADKKALRKLLPEGRAHLVSRNFPLKTEALQKKLGLVEGDPFYLYATTLADGKPLLLLCERIG